MNYANENISAKEIFQSPSNINIAIPSGRENGNVIEWINSNGIELPEITGRCLHLKFF